MTKHRPWVDLDGEDLRAVLISLVGLRFGPEPEKHLDEIRRERSEYMLKFAKMARVDAQDHVLELGSGCGFGTHALCGVANRVTACDISPAYLGYAKQELAGCNNVDLKLIESRDLSSVQDKSIDAVVSAAVFIHLNLYDIYLYFLEFKRILRGRGRVVFDFADMQQLAGGLKKRHATEQFLEVVDYYRKYPASLPGLMHFNSARGIQGVAKLAGFRKIRRRGHRLLFERND